MFDGAPVTVTQLSQIAFPGVGGDGMVYVFLVWNIKPCSLHTKSSVTFDEVGS